jgi:hypothetical protein
MSIYGKAYPEDKSEIVGDIIGIIGNILERVNECIGNEMYGVKPQELMDENGKLVRLVYNSNSEETRKMWGTSLTISYESSDEEYDQGDMDDYLNERQYYFH